MLEHELVCGESAGRGSCAANDGGGEQECCRDGRGSSDDTPRGRLSALDEAALGEREAGAGWLRLLLRWGRVHVIAY